MITPGEIREKAERLYPKAMAAWVACDTDYFPHRMRANLELPSSHVDALRDVQSLKVGSKSEKGFGYSVTWNQIRSRSHGENLFPQAIWIETLEDLVRLIGKFDEFRRLDRTISQIRSQLPLLLPWAKRHWKSLPRLDAVLPDLIQVAQYMREHPRPNCYLRELPLPISTKLSEQNKPLLTEWFNELLPSEAINHDCDPKDFERRFGFRVAHEHFSLRLLDRSLMNELQCPSCELSLPLEAIAELPVKDCRLVLVENRVSLWTLPEITRGIALGGLGNGVSQFFDILWFEQIPIRYWGDLDVEGFNILAQVKRSFPHVESILMDSATLERFSKFVIPGNEQPENSIPAPELNAAEARAFIECRDNNWRLEQERIPPQYVKQAFLEA